MLPRLASLKQVAVLLPLPSKRGHTGVCHETERQCELQLVQSCSTGRAGQEFSLILAPPSQLAVWIEYEQTPTATITFRNSTGCFLIMNEKQSLLNGSVGKGAHHQV